MQFDHIAVTRIPAADKLSGGFQLRAELQNAPPADWLARFQSAWYGSPSCRRICSEIKMDGTSIFICFRDPAQINETVLALRSIVTQTERSGFPSRHAVL